VLETDETGNPISYEEYHPYGTTAFRSAKPGFDLSLKRYRFSGKERDDETGLYYFGARYCAPWLGRWISPDPAGFVDGVNLLRYCKNSPAVHGDPTGLDPKYLPGTPEDRLTPESTPAEREAFARSRGYRVIDPNPEQQQWVGTPEKGHWELSPEGKLEGIEPEGRKEDQARPTPKDERNTTPAPKTPNPSSEPSSDSQTGADDGSEGSKERSFFTSSFFKGLVIGLAVTVAVIAVVATGGAALAAIAPAASAAIASSGVGTALAVVGTSVAVANTVQSVRQRDLWNNPISEEQANFNLGLGVGSFAGGALVRPISGAVSPIGQGLGRGLGQGIENMSSGMLVPALPGGGTFGGAISTSTAAGVSTTSAVTAAGTAMGTNVLMMSGNRGDDWDDEGWGPEKAKGKTFRGGGKSTRDNWFGYDRDKDFVKWWHRQGKAEFGGNDIDTAAEAKEVYDHWVSIGKPVPK
jgi:RHS repeat-associated protein